MSLRRAGTQQGQAKAGGGAGRESREEVALPNHPGPRAARENAIPVAKERSEGARSVYSRSQRDSPSFCNSRSCPHSLLGLSFGSCPLGSPEVSGASTVRDGFSRGQDTPAPPWVTGWSPVSPTPLGQLFLAGGGPEQAEKDWPPQAVPATFLKRIAGPTKGVKIANQLQSMARTVLAAGPWGAKCDRPGVKECDQTHVAFFIGLSF